MTIRDFYEQAVLTPSDIRKQVPTLFKYASSARRVTEFGTSLGNSTVLLRKKGKRIRPSEVISTPPDSPVVTTNRLNLATTALTHAHLPTVEIVIAKYNEDVKWLQHERA